MSDLGPADEAASPTLIAKLFALHGVQPFDRLPADELALLAEVARPHAYAPGETIFSGEQPLGRLVVITAGQALDSAGGPLGPILGVASLLRDSAVPKIVADPALGACALTISKRHFFTLARECPEFILGLLELGPTGARGQPS